MPTCLACLRAHVPKCLACLRAHVPTCLACLRPNVPCVLTCSRANVPCVLKCSFANVSSVLTCSRANVPRMLTCSSANVLFVLTCQRALNAYVPYVLPYVLTCLACLCTLVSKLFVNSRAYVRTCLESLVFASSVSSFDVTFFSFTVIVAKVVRTVGKV